MEKACISLVEAMKRAATWVDRIAERGGRASLIERDMLLAALRDTYACALALPQDETLPAPTPAAPPRGGEPAEGVSLPERANDRALDALVAQACATYAEAAAEPTYAYAEEERRPAYTQPSLEEVAGGPNDELFEPTAPSVPSQEAAQPAPVASAAPSVPPQEAAQPAPAKESREPSLFDLLNQSRHSGQPVPAVAAVAPQTLGEALSQPQRDDDEAKAKKNKVADLRTIININDKFSFMSDLFHNNMRAYNDFILRLNEMERREEALAYVRETAQQYRWDDESLSVKTFYAIFDRKF